MYSACGSAALPALGFPIRESADHRLFSASPRLFAAVHALHRLLVPRHPPCALPILTVINRSPKQPVGDTRFVGNTVQFSRSARRRPPAIPCATSISATAGGGRSLKTQQHAGGAGHRRAVANGRPCFARRARGPAGPVDIARSRPGSAPARDAPAARTGRSNPGAP